MLIFRRIFNFEKAKVEQLEKRLNQRYAPGPAFPLQATLRLAGRNCAAKIQDISSTGIGVLVDRDTDLAAGQFVRLDLLLGQHRLEIDARLMHLKPREDGAYLGLGLKFGEFELQKTYLQLMQPVVIGRSLQLMAADRIIQDDPRFFKRVYIGETDSVLTVRSEQVPGNPMDSFEFRMLDYFCRGVMRKGQPEALESMDVHGLIGGKPVFESSGGLHDEILQLFRWILPNLSSAVPDDVRAFLQRFAG